MMLIRTITILGHCLEAAAAGVLRTLLKLFLRAKATDESLFATSIVSLCHRCGGAFPKAGQLLSTRTDLLSNQVCLSLAALQDDMPPLSESQVLGALEEVYLTPPFLSFDTRAVASATIAQV